MNEQLRNIADLFWAKVEKTPNCWYWRGTIAHNGYGVITVKRRQYKAHRVAYELTFNVSLGEFFACHTCDTPLCVRPDHIFLGTSNDNVQDMIRKGRARYNVGGDLKRRIGTANGRAKLTEHTVNEIRLLHASGETTSAIARKYNISHRQATRIISGESWASHCDAEGHTRGEAGYRPLVPQVHTHELGDGLPIGARVKVTTRHDPHSGCEGVIAGHLSDDPRWKLVAFADDLDIHSYAAHELHILDETKPRGA